MLYRRYRDEGLVILGLNDERERAAALAFAKKTFSYPICLDAGPAFRQYGVRSIPATYVIDREGKIAQRHVGYGEGMEKRLEDEAVRLLAVGVTSR